MMLLNHVHWGSRTVCSFWFFSTEFEFERLIYRTDFQTGIDRQPVLHECKFEKMKNQFQFGRQTSLLQQQHNNNACFIE
jgi:hypothetical protein